VVKKIRNDDDLDIVNDIIIEEIIHFIKRRHNTSGSIQQNVE
jgi:hypothetical protein